MRMFILTMMVLLLHVAAGSSSAGYTQSSRATQSTTTVAHKSKSNHKSKSSHKFKSTYNAPRTSSTTTCGTTKTSTSKSSTRYLSTTKSISLSTTTKHSTTTTKSCRTSTSTTTTTTKYQTTTTTITTTPTQSTSKSSTTTSTATSTSSNAAPACTDGIFKPADACGCSYNLRCEYGYFGEHTVSPLQASDYIECIKFCDEKVDCGASEFRPETGDCYLYPNINKVGFNLVDGQTAFRLQNTCKNTTCNTNIKAIDFIACLYDSDCISGHCNTVYRNCGRRVYGFDCTTNSDCYSGRCRTVDDKTKICAGYLPDGTKCLDSAACEALVCNSTQVCGLSGNGDACFRNSECQSGNCQCDSEPCGVFDRPLAICSPPRMTVLGEN